MGIRHGGIHTAKVRDELLSMDYPSKNGHFRSPCADSGQGLKEEKLIGPGVAG